MVFGVNKDIEICLDGLTLKIATIGMDYFIDDLWVHDETDLAKARVLAGFYNPADKDFLPRPFRVFLCYSKNN